MVVWSCNNEEWKPSLEIDLVALMYYKGWHWFILLWQLYGLICVWSFSSLIDLFFSNNQSIVWSFKRLQTWKMCTGSFSDYLSALSGTEKQYRLTLPSLKTSHRKDLFSISDESTGTRMNWLMNICMHVNVYIKFFFFVKSDLCFVFKCFYVDPHTLFTLYVRICKSLVIVFRLSVQPLRHQTMFFKANWDNTDRGGKRGFEFACMLCW